MKKKIVIFLFSVICIVCLLCTLSGCSSNKIEYDKSSFKVDDINYSPFINHMSFDCEFTISSTIDYDIDCKYVLAIKNATTNEIAFTKECQYSGKINKNEPLTVSRYVSLYESDYASISSLMNNATIELLSVDIKVKNTQGINEQYDGYAIGFGILSALLVIGLTALLVVDKLRK